MFKKKIDLSALIHKNEKENKITSNNEIITSDLDVKNQNDNSIIIESSENNESKKSEVEDLIIEDKPKKKIGIKKNNIVEEEKNEEIINDSNSIITENKEIKYNFTTIVETNEVEQKNEEIINNTNNIIVENEEKKDDEENVETPEEIEKRYEEMTSKIEIKKEEVGYNKDDNNDLFENYKSDFELKNIDPVVSNIEAPKINNEKTSNEEEKIIIKPSKGIKILKIIISIVLISIVGVFAFLFNDIKGIFKKDNITSTGVIENSNSGITDNVDPEIKNEVDNYLEQIQKENKDLSPEEIKNKINDKIIEIYFKKAMKK